MLYPNLVGFEAPLFMKLYRPGEGGPVAGAVTALADLLEAAAVPRLHAVRPAAVLGDGDALVYRLAPGTPLSRALGAGLAPDATHLAHVGLLLRTVHAAPGPAVPLPERDLGGEVRTVHRACEAMAALRPDLGALAAGIADRVHRRLVAIEQEPLTPVHGDMKADHVLWGGQGLHVLGWQFPVGRHLETLVFIAHSLDEQALFGLFRDNSGSVLSALHQKFIKIEAKAGLLFAFSMTHNAFGVKNRMNAAHVNRVGISRVGSH